jgi:hypothetical protein
MKETGKEENISMPDELSAGGKEFISRLVSVAEEITDLRNCVNHQKDIVMGLPDSKINAAAFLWLDEQRTELELSFSHIGKAIGNCSGPM